MNYLDEYDQLVLERQKKIELLREKIVPVTGNTKSTAVNLKVDGVKSSNIHTWTLEDCRTVMRYILSQKNIGVEADKILGLPEQKEFKINGAVYADWEHNLKLRVAKLKNKSLQTKLAKAEAELESLMSDKAKRIKKLSEFDKEFEDFM
jgi:hypothetical protein